MSNIVAQQGKSPFKDETIDDVGAVELFLVNFNDDGTSERLVSGG
jgi:hypothetical protein